MLMIRIMLDFWSWRLKSGRTISRASGRIRQFTGLGLTSVLEQTLGLPDEVIAEGQAIPQTLRVTIAEHGETLRPDLVIRNPEGGQDAGKARLLVQVLSGDPGTRETSAWPALEGFALRLG